MTEFTTTFELACSPTDAWTALEKLQSDGAHDLPEPGHWWLPGFEATGTELDVDDGRRLSVRKDSMPCADTIIAVTFEHAGTGSRVTVVQSGFDEAFVEAAGEEFWNHANTIAAGFREFFEQATR